MCISVLFVWFLFSWGCTPPGSAEVTLKKVVLEKGPRRKLTSCCSSQTFKEYLFAKPNLRWFQIKLQILTACWRWARRVPFETQIGWDLGSLGPCWGIIYLSLYIPQIYSFKKKRFKKGTVQHEKQVSAGANLPNMRAEHIPALPEPRFVFFDKNQESLT